MQKQSELLVITKAGDLCAYVLTVTEKSPKQYRFTLVSRMQNLTLDVIESLYRANEIFVDRKNDNPPETELPHRATPCSPERVKRTYPSYAAEKRLDYQHTALVSLKVLATIAHIAREHGCILPKQYEQITKQIYECQNLLGAWINSDKKRYKP